MDANGARRVCKMAGMKEMIRSLCFVLLASVVVAPVMSQTNGKSTDDIVVRARDAFESKDATKLAQAREAAKAAGHPLAQWVEYWELGNRLADVQQKDLDDFYARWPGTYLEDRLRNDWLLELGKRRDWANLRVEYPRFVLKDDREAACYWLITQHLDGKPVRDEARNAWLVQRDLDTGCALMASILSEAQVLTPADVWLKARRSIEVNRVDAAQAAVALLGASQEKAFAQLTADPGRYLAQRRSSKEPADPELALLAIMHWAAKDPVAAATELEGKTKLPAPMASHAWAQLAMHAVFRQMPQAADYARRAWRAWDDGKPGSAASPIGDFLLAWQVRALLRSADDERQNWTTVLRAIEAMSAPEEASTTWVYWKARSQRALAVAGKEGDATRAAARQLLASIAAQPDFYGKLAAEELGGRQALPPKPAPQSEPEVGAVRRHAGLTRALQLIGIGLRAEGVREWNYSLRGMNERELLSAAQLACEREVWDRCINTSYRTRGEIDLTQRFPMPFKDEVLAAASKAGVDPALVFGLVKQESRFVTDARSSAGASGLMQLMPATARMVARSLSMDYKAQMINDRAVNLQLGATFLKRVLDTFDGSMAMATAAYNAGPQRPRRWREGRTIDAVAWVESIPINETRDYVKKVLSNSIEYAAILGQSPVTLRERLGARIGPREAGRPAPEVELPI
jgi:soluble lytic murein transglycosylase